MGRTISTGILFGNAKLELSLKALLAFKSRDMKKILLPILLMLVLPVAFAEPNYDVFVRIHDKDISPNEDSEFQVNVFGREKCESARITLLAEGGINFAGTQIKYSKNSRDWKDLELDEKISVHCFANNKVLTHDANRSDYNHIGFLSIAVGGQDVFPDNYDLHSLEVDGKLSPNEGAQGGDYELSALFSCLNNNVWSNFKGSQTFHVKSKFERYEFGLSFWAIIISVIAVILYWFDVRGKIISWWQK